VDVFGRAPAWVRKGIGDEADRLAGHLGGELQLTLR